MLLMPAIDLREGRCVRLYQGDFALTTRYAAAPLQLLQHYRALGAPWLHVVDLDGARDGKRGNRESSLPWPPNLASACRLAAGCAAKRRSKRCWKPASGGS